MTEQIQQNRSPRNGTAPAQFRDDGKWVRRLEQLRAAQEGSAPLTGQIHPSECSGNRPGDGALQWWGELPGPRIGPKDHIDLCVMTAAWDQLDDRGRFLLRRDGTILAAGDNARAIVMNSDNLSILEGSKLIGCGQARHAFTRLLEVAPQQTDSVILQEKRSGGHCVISAVGVCRNSVGVAIRLATGAFRPRFADLAEAFALTPSEVHVIEMLLCGSTPRDIGRELRISVHTVRAHIRHCYDKLGISSREELWQKLSPFRLN